MEISLILLTLLLLAGLNAGAAVEGVCPRPALKEASYDGRIIQAAPGTILTVHCKEEYGIESPSITCIDGQWTKPDPPCKLVKCPYPGDPGPYMEMQMPCRYYNCQTFYGCIVGYWYTGTSLITCQRDNTWTHGVGTCQAVLCPELPHPMNGKIVQRDRSYGNITTTECDEGFILNDWQAATRRCQGNNTWSGNTVVCEAVHCPQLSAPKYGRILQRDRSYKATATTLCDKGYVATDLTATIRYCQGDNNWGGKAVNCTRKECPTLKNIENGMLSALSGTYEEKVTLQCNSGYMLDGMHTVNCEASGNWDAQIGKCIRQKSDLNKNTTLIISLVTVGCIIIVSIIATVYVTTKRFSLRQGNPSESLPLLGKSISSFTFILAEDLYDVLSEETGYDSFTSTLQNSIEMAAKKLITSVEILYLCQQTRRGFLSITTKTVVDIQTLAIVISSLTISFRNLTFRVIPETVRVMDKVQITLSAQILRERHVRDKSLDEPVDFDTQYVKLKLQSHATIGIMQTEDIERPDYYQNNLRQQSGIEIEDQDLIKGNDLEKYVLLRGRAGIGKSTLMQRLLWKWANGEWATQFKAIFLLNLRYLMTVRKTVDLLFMLNMYSVYSTGRTVGTVNIDWLQKNEMGIVFVLDGVDEIDFTAFEKELQFNQEMQTMMTPLQWCFALMRRDLLQHSTLVVSSSPLSNTRQLEGEAS